MQPYANLDAAMVVVAGTAAAAIGPRTRDVVVNGVTLSPGRALDVGLPAGRYWYDRGTGLWGFEGRRAFGQMAPGLALGQPACVATPLLAAAA